MPRLRHAARVLLLDERDRVLLFRFVRPETGGVFWASPGGGLEDGEDARTAAVRELAEEVGLRGVALGAAAWWTVAELAATPDELVPRDLARLVRALLADGPPPAPVTVGV
jgi:8-oxo-dGTP pyrophosphatase MutT (NUDIX family)